MSNTFFSSDASKCSFRGNKILNRPFSSINSRKSFIINKKKNFEQMPMTDKRNIRNIIEKKLHESLNLKSTKVTYTRNNYNRLGLFDFKGKNKFSNYTLFIQREKSPKFKKAISKTIKKQINRQISASQINPSKIFREGIFNLTNLYLKKPNKVVNKTKLSNFFIQRKKQINSAKKTFQDNIKSNIESEIIDNHKYKNVNLLKKIESEKNMKKISNNLEEEKNSYLMNKKLEYISYKERKSKDLLNYMESMEQYIKGSYTNKLTFEKEKIISEEIRNENLYINDKMSMLKKSKKLYQDLFLNKFNDYVKFLSKTVDKYDKFDYLLVNEIIVLQKKIDKLKKRINTLLESKKIYNKFIILQIKLKKKTIKLPEYYEFILNHNLQEGINHCVGVLDEVGVKEIYGYKKNIIYKNFDSFNYQYKAYENENRKLLIKLGILQKEIISLNDEKKEVSIEGKKLVKYFNDKIQEKLKEKSDAINKYQSLINEKNNLLKDIKYTFTKINNHDKKSKNKRTSIFMRDFNTNDLITKKSTSNNSNMTFMNNNNKSTKGKNSSFAKTNQNNLTRKYLDSANEKYKLIIDEQMFIHLNINYEPKEKNIPSSNLYFKIRKLYLLLKNFIKEDIVFRKADKITTENSLMLKILEKVEIAMDIFLDGERDFDEKNKDAIYKVKQKIDRQRKIIKGQKYKSMVKSKHENMKRKIEEKAQKLYFLPKRKKRTVSANINKKNKNKKIKKSVEKNEYELLVDYFKEN